MKSSTASHARLLPFLILLIALPGASAQLAPVRRMPLNEHVEKYDNPPAPPAKDRNVATNDLAIRRVHELPGKRRSNGQNIIGDAANECVISVDPTDGNRMTIGWRQFNNVTSNFRQGGWGYTTDGGIHWTFPGVLENNVFRSDPVTKSDEIRKIFLSQSSVERPAVIFLRRPVALDERRPIMDAALRRARRWRRRQAMVHDRQDQRAGTWISISG